MCIINDNHTWFTVFFCTCSRRHFTRVNMIDTCYFTFHISHQIFWVPVPQRIYIYRSSSDIPRNTRSIPSHSRAVLVLCVAMARLETRRRASQVGWTSVAFFQLDFDTLIMSTKQIQDIPIQKGWKPGKLAEHCFWRIICCGMMTSVELGKYGNDGHGVGIQKDE